MSNRSMIKFVKLISLILVACFAFSACGDLAGINDNTEETGLIATQFHGEILGYEDTEDGLVILINDIFNNRERRVIIQKGTITYSDDEPIRDVIENRKLNVLVFIHSEHFKSQKYEDPYPVTTISVFEDENMVWKNYTTQTLNMLEASEFYRPLGRTAMLDTSLTCDWTAAGVEFKLLCKGDVSVGITSSTSNNAFTIEVDDAITQKHFPVNKGSGTYVVANNLEAGYHTIKIVAEKGYGSNATIDNVTFTGELVKNEARDVYIEVVGDSITCGSGLGESGNDGTAAYAYLALDELDVDYSICSNGGMGIAYAGSETNVFSEVYPYQNLKRDETPYKPTRTPDLIIVNLHTNDNWQWYSNTPDNRNAENEKYNYATFDAVFDDMIKTFTDNYGKDVPMLFVFGCMANEKYENATIRSKELIKLKYIPDGYDMEVVTLTTNREGSASHPNIEGAKTQGAELVKFIRDTYTDLFN